MLNKYAYSEQQRLLALERLNILDTGREPEFDRITHMAAELCELPLSVISLVGRNRLWFKSVFGNDDLTGLPLGDTFCETAIQSDGVFEVADVASCPEFCASTLVTEHNINYYAAAPLISVEGFRLGTLCVLGAKAGELQDYQRKALIHLSRLVVDLIETKWRMRLLGDLPGMVYRIAHVEGWVTEFISDGCTDITGFSSDELIGMEGRFMCKLIHEDDRDKAWDSIERAISTNTPYQHTVRIVARNGEERWVWEQGRGLCNDVGDLLAIEGFVTDVTESRALSEQLAYMASHDHLTGLINRRELEIRLERALLSATNNGVQHALCFLDLDQFKLINDTCGHAKGDEVLQQLCEIIRSATRSRDTVARLGGDEFILLMENCHTDVAERICDEIIKHLNEVTVEHKGQIFRVGISVGITPVTGGESVHELLHAADSACYAAKRAGGKRSIVYKDEGVAESVRVLYNGD